MNHSPQPCVSDLNDEPVFPRIGKLRLGIKHESANGNSHPANTNYFTFHCGSESLRKRFADLYGERPTAIRICLLSEDIDKVFPNNLTWYRGMLLCCKGDNRAASRAWKDVEPEIQKTLAAPASPFTKVTIPCPCPRKGDPCTLQGRFNVMLPEIQPAASVEVITGSIVNLKEIRGVLRSYKDLLGRISFVPFTLSRHAVRMQFQGKSAVQHLLQLVYQGDVASINDLRASCGLPPLPCSIVISGERTMAIAPPDETAEPAIAGDTTRTGTRPTTEHGASPTPEVATADRAVDRSSGAAGTKAVVLYPQPEAPAVPPEPSRSIMSEGPKPVIPRASIGSRPGEAVPASVGALSPTRPTGEAVDSPKTAKPTGEKDPSPAAGSTGPVAPTPEGGAKGSEAPGQESKNPPGPAVSHSIPAPGKAAPAVQTQPTGLPADPPQGNTTTPGIRPQGAGSNGTPPKPATTGCPGGPVGSPALRPVTGGPTPGSNGGAARPGGPRQADTRSAASAPGGNGSQSPSVARGTGAARITVGGEPGAPSARLSGATSPRPTVPAGSAMAQREVRCTGCGAIVSDRVAQYSKHHHGSVRCMPCQKNRPVRT